MNQILDKEGIGHLYKVTDKQLKLVEEGDS